MDGSLTVNGVLIWAGLASVLGVGALIALFVVLGRVRRTESETRHVRGRARWIGGVLEALPGGIYYWDASSDAEGCSHRLADVLKLKSGPDADFEEILTHFNIADAAQLADAAETLRVTGERFEIKLTGRENDALFLARGARVAERDGRPLADVVWLQDLSSIEGISDNPTEQVEALRAERDRFRRLIEAVPIPLWLRDKSKNIQLANEAARSLTPKPDAVLARRAHTDSTAVMEKRPYSLMGRNQMLERTEIPLSDTGETAGFALRERPKAHVVADELLSQSDPHLLDGVNTAVAIFTPDSKLVYYNPAYARLWNLDPQWLNKNPTFSAVLSRQRENRLLPEVADFAKFRQEQLDMFDGLDGSQEQMLHLPNDRTIRAVVNPHPAGGIVCAYEDLTEQLELERSHNTLMAVLRETLDALPVGVVVFGPNGKVRLSNPVFSEVWGLTKDEVREGAHINDVFESVRPRFPQGVDWPKTKSGLIDRIMGRDAFTDRIQLRNGFVLDYAAAPLPDGGVVASFHDVTDRANVEKALRERARAVETANNQRGEFMAAISQELRTPLTTIMGFIEVLLEGYFGELNARQKEYGRDILNTSQDLMALIEDIADLANMEAGRLELAREDVDLHGLMSEAVALVRERAEAKNLRLRFECPEDVGHAMGDPRRLKHALFNLLNGAVAATPKGGQVLMSAKKESGHVRITVKDGSTGLSEKDKQQLTRAFSEDGELGLRTMDKTDRGGQVLSGPGLSLTLVKNFIELHGGEMSVDSQKRKGTTVTCDLPLAS